MKALWLTNQAEISLSAIPRARHVSKARLNSLGKLLPQLSITEWLLSTPWEAEELSHWNLPQFLALKTMACNRTVKSLGVEMVSYAAIDNQYYLLTSSISSSSIWVSHQNLLSLGFLKRFLRRSCSLMLLFPFSTWDHSPFSPKRNNGLCFMLNRTCFSLDY